MKELTIKRKSFVWNKWNREHIENHNLIPRQAEQALYDKNKIVQDAYAGRFMVIGKCGKRMISVILNTTGKKFYVVTARDADKEEREIYRKNVEENAYEKS